jgi:hypothetical protein
MYKNLHALESIPALQVLPTGILQHICCQMVSCKHAALQEAFEGLLLSSDSSISLQLPQLAGSDPPPMPEQLAAVQAFLYSAGAVRECLDTAPLTTLTINIKAAGDMAHGFLSLPCKQPPHLRHLSISLGSTSTRPLQLELQLSPAPSSLEVSDRLPALTSLKLHTAWPASIQLAAGQGWDMLAGLTGLRQLSLSRVAVTAAADGVANPMDLPEQGATLAEVLGSMTQLTCLQLTGDEVACQLGGVALSTVSCLSQLQDLSLYQVGTAQQPLSLLVLPSSITSLTCMNCCIGNSAGSVTSQGLLPAMCRLHVSSHLDQKPGSDLGPAAATAAVAQLVAAAPMLYSLHYDVVGMHHAEAAPFEDASAGLLLDAVAQLRQLKMSTLQGLKAPSPANNSQQGVKTSWRLRSNSLWYVQLHHCRLPATVLQQPVVCAAAPLLPASDCAAARAWHSRAAACSLKA